MSKSLCCDFSYPFAEALGAEVIFLLALVADDYFRRTGTTEVWALSTSGTLLAALLLLKPLLCYIGFGSMAAASPVCVYVALCVISVSFSPLLRMVCCFCTASRCLTISLAFSSVRLGSIWRCSGKELSWIFQLLGNHGSFCLAGFLIDSWLPGCTD